MSYTKAADVLPQELIDMIQSYVDGEYLYIPRKEGKRREWGAATDGKEKTRTRNEEICRRHGAGQSTNQIALDFCLSQKSVQKIVAKGRREGV